jgi:hypothetical protein
LFQVVGQFERHKLLAAPPISAALVGMMVAIASIWVACIAIPPITSAE